MSGDSDVTVMEMVDDLQEEGVSLGNLRHARAIEKKLGGNTSRNHARKVLSERRCLHCCNKFATKDQLCRHLAKRKKHMLRRNGREALLHWYRHLSEKNAQHDLSRRETKLFMLMLSAMSQLECVFR